MRGFKLDHDDETRGTIFSRREALLRLGGVSFVAFLWPTASSQAADTATQASPQSGAPGPKTLIATPELTEGPYFEDGVPKRANLLEGTTRAAVAGGVPLELKIRVWELSGKTGAPLAGAKVDVWHCDAAGVYSDEAAAQGNAEDTRGQNWLRGWQTTDSDGYATFQTIWPGWYPGRAVHIHFKIRLMVKDKAYEFTSQWFFDEALNEKVMAKDPYKAKGEGRTRNQRDGIFRERQAGGGTAGEMLLLKLSELPSGGYRGEFDVAFDSDGL